MPLRVLKSHSALICQTSPQIKERQFRNPLFSSAANCQTSKNEMKDASLRGNLFSRLPRNLKFLGVFSSSTAFCCKSPIRHSYRASYKRPHFISTLISGRIGKNGSEKKPVSRLFFDGFMIAGSSNTNRERDRHNET